MYNDDTNNIDDNDNTEGINPDQPHHAVCTIRLNHYLNQC